MNYSIDDHDWLTLMLFPGPLIRLIPYLKIQPKSSIQTVFWTLQTFLLKLLLEDISLYLLILLSWAHFSSGHPGIKRTSQLLYTLRREKAGPCQVPVCCSTPGCLLTTLSHPLVCCILSVLLALLLTTLLHHQCYHHQSVTIPEAAT